MNDYQLQYLNSEGEWLDMWHCGLAEPIKRDAKEQSEKGGVTRVMCGNRCLGVWVNGEVYK